MNISKKSVYFERGRESLVQEQQRARERERERVRESQAGFTLSVEPDVGLDLMTVGS